MPVLQGVQERLPGRRRHGDVQGGVPGALLPRTAAAAASVRVRAGSTGGRALASQAPRLANAAAHAPGLARLAKWVAGVAPERDMPRFATRTLRDWFFGEHDGRSSVANASPAPDPGPLPVAGRQGVRHPRRVLLWPDTFNNSLPSRTSGARRWRCWSGRLSRSCCRAGCSAAAGRCTTSDSWARRAGCCATIVARAALRAAGRHADRRARAELHRRLSRRGSRASSRTTWTSSGSRGRAWLLGEFLEKYHVGPRAAVHPAQGARARALPPPFGARLGARRRGSWTASASTGAGPSRAAAAWPAPSASSAGKRHEVSLALGERLLAPAVRAADPDTLLIADGFSCREQIRQLTGRMPLHLAELLRRGADAANPAPGRTP